MADSKLDLVIAGTSDAVLMIEGFCSFLSEEQMLEAVEAGHAAIGVACAAISEWYVHHA
jgi:polyribonucleotide nucleotidyltransferase